MICNNPAKMPITSTSHEWTQIDQEASSMAVASKGITDKPPQDLQQPLRCPRCDSSNTKFCYYNNYSLTQPRHFCKACKRYWTRGGTLRNVPVGGSCRKNKRVKRPAAASGDTPTTVPHLSQGQSDSCTIAKTPLNMASLAFPSLQPQLTSLNYDYLSIPRSSSSLDLPPSLMNSLNWMTFPPGATHASNNSDDLDQYQHGSFAYTPTNQFQNQSIASSSLWPNDLTTSQFLGSSAPSEDLLASTLNQQKLMNGMKEPSGLQVLFPINGDHHSNILSKGSVKMEEDNIASMGSKMDWQAPHCNSSMHDNINSGSNIYWNSGVFGSWVEANAHGSLTPLL